MTDEPRPDARDDELSSLLEVPRLDDETRRRLVSRAVDEARPATERPWRSRVLVPVAAALVALVVLGVGVFAFVGRDGGDTDRAARAPKAATPGATSTPPDASPSAEAAVGIRDLGDLGDVSDPDSLRRQVRARLGAPPSSARAAVPACLARAAAGVPPPSAYGTGTYRGRSVLVLLTPANGDRSTAVLLATRTCRPVSVSDLS